MEQCFSSEYLQILNTALEQAGINYITEVYSNAKHGFTMADLPAYDKAAAELHYERLFALFAHCLKLDAGNHLSS